MNSFYPPLPTVLGEGATLPAYAHAGDAGLDLSVVGEVLLRPGEHCIVTTKVSVAIPAGFVGLVVPRSGWGSRGLVLRHAIDVIDSGYRGEIHLPLWNINKNDWIHIHPGERVAQLIIVPVAQVQVVQVEDLDDTERGTGGFGSSGYGRL